MLSNKELVASIWHDKVEDKQTWKFCAGIIKQDYDIELSPQEVKKRFQSYFKEAVGIKPYTKCPWCQKELLPRKSLKGYFIGCSGCPDCRFMATSEKPFLSKKEQMP